MKQTYELPIIISANMSFDAAEQYLETEVITYLKKANVEELVVESGGKITLAYPIKKLDSGYFYIIHFSAEGTAVDGLAGYLNLRKEIVRYLLLKVPPPQTVAPVAVEKPIEKEVVASSSVAPVEPEPAKKEAPVAEPATPEVKKPRATRAPQKKTPKVPIKEIDKKLEDIFKETL